MATEEKVTILAILRDKFTQNSKKINKELVSFKDNTKVLTKQLGPLASKLSLVAAAFAGLKISRVGQDLEESTNKFDSVFKNLSGQAGKELDAFSKRVGRSQLEMRKFAATMQDTFVPLGLAREEAKKLSLSIVELGVDIASLSNKADADVIRDIQSALVGNTETVRKYGVSITEARIKQEAFNQGLDPKKLDGQQKALLRFKLILDDSADSVGDAEKTQASFANQVKRLQGEFIDMTAAGGQLLNDVLLPFVQELNELVPAIKEWVNENKGLISAMVSVAGKTVLLVAAFKSLKILITISRLMNSARIATVAFGGSVVATSKTAVKEFKTIGVQATATTVKMKAAALAAKGFSLAIGAISTLGLTLVVAAIGDAIVQFDRLKRAEDKHRKLQSNASSDINDRIDALNELSDANREWAVLLKNIFTGDPFKAADYFGAAQDIKTASFKAGNSLLDVSLAAMEADAAFEEIAKAKVMEKMYADAESQIDRTTGQIVNNQKILDDFNKINVKSIEELREVYKLTNSEILAVARSLEKISPNLELEFNLKFDREFTEQQRKLANAAVSAIEKERDAEQESALQKRLSKAKKLVEDFNAPQQADPFKEVFEARDAALDKLRLQSIQLIGKFQELAVAEFEGEGLSLADARAKALKLTLDELVAKLEGSSSQRFASDLKLFEDVQKEQEDIIKASSAEVSRIQSEDNEKWIKEATERNKKRISEQIDDEARAVDEFRQGSARARAISDENITSATGFFQVKIDELEVQRKIAEQQNDGVKLAQLEIEKQKLLAQNLAFRLTQLKELKSSLTGQSQILKLSVETEGGKATAISEIQEEEKRVQQEINDLKLQGIRAEVDARINTLSLGQSITDATKQDLEEIITKAKQLKGELKSGEIDEDTAVSKLNEQALVLTQTAKDAHSELSVLISEESDPLVVEQLKSMQAELEKMPGTVLELNDQLDDNADKMTLAEQQFEQLVTSMDAGTQTILANSFEGLFADIITGSRSAKDSFRQFAHSMLSNIAQMLIKMAALRVAQLALGGGGTAGGIGTLVSGLFHQGGVIKRNNGGAIPHVGTGAVQGPDVNTDVVPALLTPREFVVRRRAADFYGPHVMHAINNKLIPRSALTGFPSGSVRHTSGAYNTGGTVSPTARTSGALQEIQPAVIASESGFEQMLAGGQAALIRSIRDNRSEINTALGSE